MESQTTKHPMSKHVGIYAILQTALPVLFDTGRPLILRRYLFLAHPLRVTMSLLRMKPESGPSHCRLWSGRLPRKRPSSRCTGNYPTYCSAASVPIPARSEDRGRRIRSTGIYAADKSLLIHVSDATPVDRPVGIGNRVKESVAQRNRCVVSRIVVFPV